MPTTRVLTLIASLRLFANCLCRNKHDADRLIKETLAIAINNIGQEARADELLSNLLSHMRKRFYGASFNEGATVPEPDNYLVCLPHAEPPKRDFINLQGAESAIRLLPLHLREALVLVVILNQNVGEAASVMDCEAATVTKRINRARNVLHLLTSGPLKDDR